MQPVIAVHCRATDCCQASSMLCQSSLKKQKEPINSILNLFFFNSQATLKPKDVIHVDPYGNAVRAISHTYPMPEEIRYFVHIPICVRICALCIIEEIFPPV